MKKRDRKDENLAKLCDEIAASAGMKSIEAQQVRANIRRREKRRRASMRRARGAS